MVISFWNIFLGGAFEIFVCLETLFFWFTSSIDIGCEHIECSTVTKNIIEQ